MDADRINADERLTGRKVIAFVGGEGIGAEIASERLILDSSLSPATLGPVRPPQAVRTIGGYGALRAEASGRERAWTNTPSFTPRSSRRLEKQASRVGLRPRWRGEPCS
jgi:hypothetical protein